MTSTPEHPDGGSADDFVPTEELAHRQGVSRSSRSTSWPQPRPVGVRRGVRSLPRRSLRLPPRRPRVSLVVVDTDVASTLLRRRASDTLARQTRRPHHRDHLRHLRRADQWTFVRQWGPRSLDTMRTFLAALVVLPYDQRVATSWGEIQAHAQLRGRPRPINDSWIAACCLARELPLARSTSRTTPTSPSTRASNSSTEDTRRGMPRGTNHSPREATRDTGREQKAQVGRQKASAITRSTGLRRRERRFESCRGHHA